MKVYVLKYKNYYLRYIFDQEYEEEYIDKVFNINNATMYEDLKDTKEILKEIKEGNIKLIATQNEIEEIKNKTYILEIEIKEIGEINNG